jgi:hypothetical protein
MKDPDIADTTEARDVVGFYEWALGDNVGIHTTFLYWDHSFKGTFLHMCLLCIPLFNFFVFVC